MPEKKPKTFEDVPHRERERDREREREREREGKVIGSVCRSFVRSILENKLMPLFIQTAKNVFLSG